VTREVVLAHGLWMPALAMQMLGARLAERGFRCHAFGYAGRAKPLEAHAERLARFARGLGPAHFVGHSLGGLVVLEMLDRHPRLACGNVVLLGTPARGCLGAQRLAKAPLGHWMLGQSAGALLGARAPAWSRPEPLGVIAGSLPLGLGLALGPLPGANDGVVRVEESGVEGMRERIVLPVSHSAMLLSARVAANVASFLSHAKFLSHGR